MHLLVSEQYIDSIMHGATIKDYRPLHLPGGLLMFLSLWMTPVLCHKPEQCCAVFDFMISPFILLRLYSVWSGKD